MRQTDFAHVFDDTYTPAQRSHFVDVLNHIHEVVTPVA